VRTACLCLAALALGGLAGGAPAAAVEGKWTPEQVLELDPAWLRSLGLRLPPERLWRRQGGGLLDAAVRVGGCSASFISAQGLLITNHHCAFGILQQHSTPERNLIESGYLAAGRDRELPGANLRATLPHRTTDVTGAIEQAAAAAGADDLVRYQAIEREKKQLVATCERHEGQLPGPPTASPPTSVPLPGQPSSAPPPGQPPSAPSPGQASSVPAPGQASSAPATPAIAARRCEVATFDGGVRYLLIESREYPDVRLVYAPPRAVGDFGGEVDNWSWPRHSGDFALLRVYAAPDGMPAPRTATSVPLRPPHFFPVAAAGVRPGDFVMVAGYPGTTVRSLTAPEMRERGDRFLPRRAELLRAWLDLMESAARANAAAGIALADRIKGLGNAEKNARGQIAGLRRGRTLERKEAADRETLAWAAAKAPAAAAAYRELSRLVEQRLASWDRDFLLGEARLGPKPLDLAMTLVRHAREAAKPDLEREPPYMDRNRDRLQEGLRRDQSRLDPPAEAALLADLLARFAALPEPTRVTAVERLLAGLPPGGGTAGVAAPRFERAALAAKAAAMVAGSRVTDLEERMRMLDESAAQLAARHDPLLDLAASLDDALREAEERDHRFRGAVARLRPAWRRAEAAHAGGRPLAPDANGTLRVSFAHVAGYAPRDGVWMQPQTRVAGVVEKQTGSEPFDAPAALLAAAPRAPASRWADAGLHDVPVCFLADADTAGGSSGSPVLNGRGELVGVNFDRVWENVANDFGYDPPVARNVSVDVRYLFWVLETLDGDAAAPLLEEMGLAAR